MKSYLLTIEGFFEYTLSFLYQNLRLAAINNHCKQTKSQFEEMSDFDDHQAYLDSYPLFTYILEVKKRLKWIYKGLLNIQLPEFIQNTTRQSPRFASGFKIARIQKHSK